MVFKSQSVSAKISFLRKQRPREARMFKFKDNKNVLILYYLKKYLLFISCYIFQIAEVSFFELEALQELI